MMIRKTLIIGLFAATALSGCSDSVRKWNQGAGNDLDGGNFGNATMQNHIAHSCRSRSAGSFIGKHNSQYGKCAGRLQDGKYAKVAYDETVSSATEPHDIAVTAAGE